MIVRLMPGRVLSIYLEKYPGRNNPRMRPNTSCRSKDAQVGRVDPAATFHGIEHNVACVVDCHKNRNPAQKPEPEEIRALLDSWESRTGRRAPSRR
jgi:hypothetical protein